MALELSPEDKQWIREEIALQFKTLKERGVFSEKEKFKIEEYAIAMIKKYASN